MNFDSIWPFFFEVNVVERRTGRGRTLFVTVAEDGSQQWVDHSGRLGRMGGLGGFHADGKGGILHFRGGQQLPDQEIKREKEEFTVSITSEDYDSVMTLDFIRSIGRPWLAGWKQEDSLRLHEMLEAVYWRSVNTFVHDPFDVESE